MSASKPAHTRPDANQGDVIAALRQAGCTVWDLHEVGLTFPDILVGVPWANTTLQHRLPGGTVRYDSMPGGNLLIEIKTEHGKLREGQSAFFAAWPGPKAVVRNIEQAFEACGIEATRVPTAARNVAQTGGK